MLFPARLKVIYKQKALFFNNPDEAMEWAEITLTPHSSQNVSQNSHRQHTQMHKTDKFKTDKHKTAGVGQEINPTLEQITESQRDALLAAATLIEQDVSSIAETVNSSEDPDPQSDTENSLALFPVVTPQTANDF